MYRRIVCIWLVIVMIFGFIVIIIEIAPVARAKTITVDDSGGANYTTIQEAVDAATDGDTVYVYSGSYNECVNVNKTINLTGEDIDTTIIVGDADTSAVRVTSNFVNITGFTVMGGDRWYAGIMLSDVRDCNIYNNNVSSNNYIGIHLSYANYNTIMNNTVSFNAVFGILIDHSEQNTLSGNKMEENGIFIGGGKKQWYHTIDTSNTVNGKPVQYYSDQSQVTFPSEVGQVILVNCTDTTISDIELTNATAGIELGFSSNITISQNNISSNTVDGIYLYNSDDNTIRDNFFYSNNDTGIYLLASDENTIENNNLTYNNIGCYFSWSFSNDVNNNSFTNNDLGLNFDSSDDNIVQGNTISDSSWRGLGLWWSSGNDIYHNNFVDNAEQVFNEGGNSFHDGYPSGGNYWSDYTGSDDFSGINQDQPGSDGIGDDPYPIQQSGQDTFPLMVPYVFTPPIKPVHNLDKDIYYDLIQEAIDDADPGNTIFVSNGTYYENVVIDKSIFLTGENRDITIIDGGDHQQTILITDDLVSISGFTIINAIFGIKVESDSNTISSCNISFNGNYGIYTDYSDNNHIFDNIICSNDRYGIYLYYSTGNIIEDNSMIENGIHLHGVSLQYWNTHTIPTSNTVNGKSIYYLKDQTGGTIPTDAGQVILVNSQDVRIEDQIFTHGDVCIIVAFSSNNFIINNTASNIYDGIYVYKSNSNIIKGNNVSTGNWRGMYLHNSNKNLITENNASNNDAGGIVISNSGQNNITDNKILSNNDRGIIIVGWLTDGNNITQNTISGNIEAGIALHFSERNTIYSNTISNNGYGIYLDSSANNRIYHNYLSDNTNQAFDDGNSNIWNDTYPSGGNYWSDYVGNDNLSGPNQDQPGSDGIGDTNYSIDSDSFDYYPLMEPIFFGPIHNIDKDLYYDKIQDAINDSDHSDTIFVSSGTYYENVVIDKTITLIGEDRNTTIINGSGDGDVILITANWVNITGFTSTGSDSDWDDAGIELNYVQNCSVINNNFWNNRYRGIYLRFSNSNNIIDNNITSNGGNGIRIEYSNSNNIDYNNISDNTVGIFLSSSEFNQIMSNNIYSNRYDGIRLYSSSRNRVYTNNLSYNEYGIHLYGTNEENIESNTLIMNGILITGSILKHWNTHTIYNSNTVNGKPIYYLKNQVGGTIPSGAGQVIIANCTNVKIEKQELSEGCVGIEMGFSSNNEIIENNISSNKAHGIYIFYSNDNYLTNNEVSLINSFGIHIENSDRNTLMNNKIFSNTREGIRLEYSKENSIINNSILNNSDGIVVLNSNMSNIIGNNISYNWEGIDVQYSIGNNITNNVVTLNKWAINFVHSSCSNISYNIASLNEWYGIKLHTSSDNNSITNNQICSNGDFGILIDYSANNHIYHNDINDNPRQASDNSGDNHWDNGYPYGGNYWSDYIGEDEYSGSNQDQEGNDGIGDTPYTNIEGGAGAQDNYPRIKDTNPPVIEIISPENNSVIKPDSIINLSISDLNLVDVTYAIDNGIYMPLPYPYDINTSDWDDKTYKIEIHARDAYENTNWAYYNFTIDSVDPQIVLNSPMNESYINEDIEINFTISDSNLDEVTYSKNNGTITLLFSPYNIDTTSWSEGEYFLIIHAEDKASNQKENTFFFTKDETSPEISLISPQNESIIEGAVILDFSISDSNIDTVSYSVNEGSMINLDSPFDIDTSSWNDGEYIIDIYTEDKAGNYNRKSFKFTKDTRFPEITLNSPQNESMIMEISTLDFEVSDVNLNTVSYSINQGTFQTFEDPYDLDTTDWNDGEYIITIRAEDTAGHINEQWYIFRLDFSTPSIASSSINDNAQDVDVDTEVIIEFSEPMDCDSVESALSIDPYTDYSCSWSSDNKTLAIAFSEPLQYDTLYQISISTQASDMADKDLEEKFELKFTTEPKPKDKGEEGLPLMYLLLSLIMAIIVALLIVFMLLAKKKKSSTEMVAPEIESPAPMQVKCPSCNNLLQVNDIGTTMNVTCPFCSTLLTVQSQKGPAETLQPPMQPQPVAQPEIQPHQPTIQISCPQCLHKFSVAKTQGPIRVQCPNCGVSGTLG